MAGSKEGEVIACHTIEEWKAEFGKANESKKLVVIDFTASWCPPCRMIAPVFAELSKKFFSVAVFLKVDVDELKEVAAEFKVEAMPTFVFLKEGKVVETIVGARKDMLETSIAKHGDLVAASASA